MILDGKASGSGEKGVDEDGEVLRLSSVGKECRLALCPFFQLSRLLSTPLERRESSQDVETFPLIC